MSVAKRNLVIYVLSTVWHVQLFTILVASSRRVIAECLGSANNRRSMGNRVRAEAQLAAHCLPSS